MSPDWPQETLVTVTFAENDGQTVLTLKHSLGSVPVSERNLWRQGWNESLDKLAGELARA
jgi:hypothetical protein